MFFFGVESHKDGVTTPDDAIVKALGLKAAAN